MTAGGEQDGAQDGAQDGTQDGMQDGMQGTGGTDVHAAHVPATTAPVAVPPLDERAPLLGPVTRRVLGRAGLVYAVLWVAGVALASTGDPRLSTLGAGLVLPGGGHLASGHLVHGVLVLLGLLVAVLLWWMIGAAVLPLALLLLDLVALALLAHHEPTDAGLVAVAVAGPALVAACLLLHAVRHRRRRGRAARLNTALAAAAHRVTVVPSRPTLPVGEASAEDLRFLRLALDLALQPVEDFAGFDRRDQFREAALRYQLCILGYALSTYRFGHAPALAGYLTEAQARAILKTGDRRVWGYWALENAWGRFSPRRDPVDNGDNVMLTGWQGAAVGMFETLEDDRFSAPGALTYRWSDTESYAYDQPSLVASLERNIERSAYGFFSCEPRWIYPVCNSFAVTTLLMDRRLNGGTGFDRLEGRLRRAFTEEFHRPDGRVVGVRSETLGLSWSPWSGDGVWLPTTFWTHATFPDLAHRSWWLLRETVLQERDGRWALPATLANRCDSGSYAFGRETFGQVFLAMTAREMGDERLAADVLRHLAETEEVAHAGGASRWAGLSTQGNLYALVARFGREAGMRDLVAGGVPATWRTGPRIAEAAYPDVLVARAVTDGAALHAVLHPGAGARRTTLELERLRPHAAYVVRGGTDPRLVADAAGRARVTLDLEGRHPLAVEPVS